jgi:hypothetical protein
MNFIDSLNLEIKGLEHSLEASPDPRLLKLRELRHVLALYTGVAAPEAPQQATDPTPAPHPTKQKPGRKISPERQEAIDATTKILRQTPGPIKTAELFDLISKMGIKLGGTDAQNNYAALLYGRDEFQSHGREGWTLAKEEAVIGHSQIRA